MLRVLSKVGVLVLVGVLPVSVGRRRVGKISIRGVWWTRSILRHPSWRRRPMAMWRVRWVLGGVLAHFGVINVLARSRTRGRSGLTATTTTPLLRLGLLLRIFIASLVAVVGPFLRWR